MNVGPYRAWRQESYAAAWRFAAQAHEGQKEPVASLPYILHLGSVAMETLGALREAPVFDEELAVQCALLHDTLEDTATRYDDLATEFGEAVARGVRALSKDASLPKAAQMADSLTRIRAQPREVWLVKMADRVCNLRPPIPAHWSHTKAVGYRDEAVTIVDALGDASDFMARRLREKIDAYQHAIDALASRGRST